MDLRKDSPDGKPLEGNNKYEGYVADIASEVAERVGIEYTLQPVRDGKYGSQEDDGSWNGMIGELIRGVSINQLCSFLLFVRSKNVLYLVRISSLQGCVCS